MDSNISRAKRVYRMEGLRELLRKSLKFFSRRTRSMLADPPFIKNRIGVYNGVAVRDIGFFQRSDVQSDYENDLIISLNRHVNTGDTVVIVGGGLGVTTVAAAKAAGQSGQVITYEGSESRINSIRETLSLNDVAADVSVRHAVVGSAISVKGDATRANVVEPRHLPDCDILELDCEGAEIEILEKMTIRPRLITVETHSHLGAPEDKVVKILDELGYEVISKGEYSWEGSVVTLSAKRIS